MKRRREYSESGEEEVEETQISADYIALLRALISREAASYQPILQYKFGNVGAESSSDDEDQVPIDAVTINTALGQFPGFEPGLGLSEGEDQYEGEGEDEDEDEGEVIESPRASREYATQSGGDEVDEDDEYIDQTAEEIVGEALEELLDEVIGEIRRDYPDGPPPDPQAVRWLILEDAEFAAELDKARTETVSDLKETISDLLQQPGMGET